MMLALHDEMLAGWHVERINKIFQAARIAVTVEHEEWSNKFFLLVTRPLAQGGESAVRKEFDSIEEAVMYANAIAALEEPHASLT